MKPLIGITTYYVKDRELGKNRSHGFQGQDMMICTMDNVLCVEKSGGIPIPIPVLEDNEEYIEELMQKLDGIIFTGGSDVHPLEYGQQVKLGLGSVIPERDIFELKLLKKALDCNKPILGICRGLQIINVFFGGTLHQDLYKGLLTNIDHVGTMLPKFSPCHKVDVIENSKIYAAYKKNEIMVNSFHHQAIDKLGNGLVETAWSEDGIVEGLEHTEYPFLVGVQWHPEAMFEKYSDHLNIYKLFIKTIQNM